MHPAAANSKVKTPDFYAFFIHKQQITPEKSKEKNDLKTSFHHREC